MKTKLIILMYLLHYCAFAQNDTLFPLIEGDNNYVSTDTNSITTGKNNISVGIGAGQGITTGRNNTFFGELTGAGITSYSSNTFIGRKAGENADSTESSVMVGKESGRLGTKNSFSIFIGANAGKNGNYLRSIILGTTASYNSNINHNDITCIGNWSMAENLYNVDSTVAIGASSAWNLQDDSKKGVFLGTLSGQKSGGNGNLFIGYESGSYNIGDHNLFIGYQSGINETSTDSTLVIGDANIDLIRGDFRTGNIEIQGNLNEMFRHITTNDTLRIYDKVVECSGTSNFYLLPLNEFKEGHDIEIWNIGDVVLNIVPYGTDKINGQISFFKVFPGYNGVILRKGRTSWLMREF